MIFLKIENIKINSFGKLKDKEINLSKGINLIYGKNEAGEKKTYLIDYDADSSNDMTVWIDGNVNGEYSDDMRLSPMIEILNNSDWTSQVEAWAETFEEQQIYEILYMGRRSFSSEEGLQYISGDADGRRRFPENGSLSEGFPRWCGRCS